LFGNKKFSSKFVTRFIVLMEENLRKIKCSVIKTKEREKLIDEFLQFVETNSIAVPNFKFNREECYDRQMFF